MVKPLAPVRRRKDCIVSLTVASVSGLVPSMEEVLGHCLGMECFPSPCLRGTLDEALEHR